MPLGVWGSGVLSGVVADLLTVCELLSGYNGYFLRSWEFRQKSKDSKKCYLIQFLHIFIWKVKGWFRADFVRFSAVKSLQASTRAIYNAIFRWFPLIARSERAFKRYFRRVFRPRLPFCGCWWCWFRVIRLYMYIYHR